MTQFSERLSRPAAAMLLEAEGQRPIVNPSEEQVRALVLSLRMGEISFAYLTDEAGNYVQLAGSRPWCVIEYRRLKPLQHDRAFQDTPTPKYKDGAKFKTGAGNISLRHDEWSLLKEGVEVLAAFLRKDRFPANVQWRSMIGTLGLG